MDLVDIQAVTLGSGREKKALQFLFMDDKGEGRAVSTTLDVGISAKETAQCLREMADTIEYDTKLMEE